MVGVHNLSTRRDVLMFAAIIKQTARLVLVTIALLSSVAVVVAGVAACFATDKTPRLTFNKTSISAAHGRVQASSDNYHEEILSDRFAADPSVSPPITSRRQLTIPGFHFASILWGDNRIWVLSVNSLALSIFGFVLLGVIAYYSFRPRHAAVLKTSGAN